MAVDSSDSEGDSNRVVDLYDRNAEWWTNTRNSNFPDHKWSVCDMRNLENCTVLANRKFGGVLAWDSFFHLNQSDQKPMFQIFANHLVENGVLVFTSGPEAGSAMGELNGEPIYHASLSQEEYRDLLGASGFEVVEYCERDRSCGNHTVWKCRLTGKSS